MFSIVVGQTENHPTDSLVQWLNCVWFWPCGLL